MLYCFSDGVGGACPLQHARGLPAIASRGVAGLPGSSRLLLSRQAPPSDAVVTRCPLPTRASAAWWLGITVDRSLLSSPAWGAPAADNCV